MFAIKLCKKENATAYHSVCGVQAIAESGTGFTLHSGQSK
jgi:hypothetical protein